MVACVEAEHGHASSDFQSRKSTNDSIDNLRRSFCSVTGPTNPLTSIATTNGHSSCSSPKLSSTNAGLMMNNYSRGGRDSIVGQDTQSLGFYNQSASHPSQSSAPYLQPTFGHNQRVVADHNLSTGVPHEDTFLVSGNCFVAQQNKPPLSPAKSRNLSQRSRNEPVRASPLKSRD